MPPYQPSPVPTVGPLQPRVCKLAVRQQPREGLVTLRGKEKTRKPLDPPPIVQLDIESRADPSQQYLQNPYIFMSVLLWDAENDEPVKYTATESLTGTLVSSLHRLKDPTRNEDGAYFIFGDISVKIAGRFRLCMNLYEEVADPLPDSCPGGGSFQSLGRVLSKPFDVVPAKDFKGLEESTYLSRAFSDQGVRLRLRKEARGMMGNKRQHADEEPTNPSIAPNTPIYDYSQQQQQQQQHQQQQQQPKRRRTDYIDSPVTPNTQIPVPVTLLPQRAMMPPQRTMMPPQHEILPSHAMQQQQQQHQHRHQHQHQQHPPPPSIPNNYFMPGFTYPMAGVPMPNPWAQPEGQDWS